MRFVNLVLVVLSLLCGSALRLDFANAGNTQSVVIPADDHDEHFPLNSDRSVPIEEESKEVKEITSKGCEKLCCGSTLELNTELNRVTTFVHFELRYYETSRDLFNRLGRLRI
jgi:hypothetical protein